MNYIINLFRGLFDEIVYLTNKSNMIDVNLKTNDDMYLLVKHDAKAVWRL